MVSSFALLLAAAAPTANADGALVALHDSICVRYTQPGGDFRPAARAEMPADLHVEYIGPSEDRYWRRAGPLPAYVLLSRGPGHWGGVEEYCVVAIQGARFEQMVRLYAERLRIRWIFGPDGRPLTWEHGGLVNSTLSGNRGQGSILVTQRPDGWVSLLSGGMVTAQTQRPSR